MRKKNEWEKRKIFTASFRTTPFSFALEPEIDYLSREVGLNNTADFMDFLRKNSELTQQEFDKALKEFVLKLSKIEGRNLSKIYRKYRAEKIMELHEKKEIKQRMKDYVYKKEFL